MKCEFKCAAELVCAYVVKVSEVKKENAIYSKRNLDEFL